MSFQSALRPLTLLVCIAISPALHAQRLPRPKVVLPGQGNGTNPQGPNASKFISGKVVIDDGTILTDPAIIQSVCKGQRHAEVYTDSSGNFNFEFGKQRPTYGDVESSSMGTLPTISPSGRSTTDRYSPDCQLQAVLPGFTSDLIELSRYQDEQMINIGNISLHRLKNVEGYTISATTAAAPPDARKAYEKAREDESKGKLQDAEKKLQKAVSIYPAFAVAWVELGRLQAHFKNFDVARQSFIRATSVDPKLITPYQQLAQIAFQQRQWEELVNVTEQLLRLNSLSFPQEWFFNAVGNFYLNRFGPAEKSAREGLKTDLEHKVPKADYLLALILMQKKDFSGAAEHFRNYLAHIANPADAAAVQAQLADAERLSRATLGENASQR